MENGRLLRHFGLLSEPFRVSPRRRDFFPPGVTPKPFDALIGKDGTEPVRLLLVEGEAGTGRTSMLRQLADTLRPAGWRVFTVETETVPHPEHLSDDDILLAACRNFGLFRAMTERRAGAATESLRENAGAGPASGPIAIAVDDADRLGDAALAGLLRLAVLVPADAPGRSAGVALASRVGPDLAVMLSGPPDLRQRLDQVAAGADLPLLWDGAASDLTLRPLSRDEITAYVEHCLEVAGCPEPGLFDDEALDRLEQLSHGVLGELNAIASQAMIFAWQSSRRTIGADLVVAPGSCPPVMAPTPAIQSRALVVVEPPGPSNKKARAKRRRLLLGGSAIGLLVAAVVATPLIWPETRGYFSTGGEYLRAAFSTPAANVPANGIDETTSGRVAVVVPGPTTLQPSIGDQLIEVPGEATEDFLVARGEDLLRGADAVSARRFFGRAAESGSAAAATAMASSYDPVYLERAAIRGVEADAEQAAAWYRIAIARGDGTAHERLDALVAAMATAPTPPQ